MMENKWYEMCIKNTENIAKLLEMQKQCTENIKNNSKQIEHITNIVEDNELKKIQEKIKPLEPLIAIMKYPKIVLVGVLISYLFTISEIRAVVLKSLF